MAAVLQENPFGKPNVVHLIQLCLQTNALEAARLALDRQQQKTPSSVLPNLLSRFLAPGVTRTQPHRQSVLLVYEHTHAHSGRQEITEGTYVVQEGV